MSDAEFRVEFNTDEGYREVRGQDMSTVGPGPGNQRAILEGEFGGARNRLLRGENTPEQTFRSSALKYLEGAYRGMEMRQRQSLVDEGLQVPNYQNLVMPLLVAALYFRHLAPILRNRTGITSALLDEYAPIVLAPLLKDKDSLKSRQRKIPANEYLVQLKGDLLRYLRYLLPV